MPLAIEKNFSVNSNMTLFVRVFSYNKNMVTQDKQKNRESRRANHQSGLRMAKLILILVKRKYPVSLSELCRVLEVKERTVKDYVYKINEQLGPFFQSNSIIRCIREEGEVRFELMIKTD